MRTKNKNPNRKKLIVLVLISFAFLLPAQDLKLSDTVAGIPVNYDENRIEPDFAGGSQYGVRGLYMQPGQTEFEPDEWGMGMGT